MPPTEAERVAGRIGIDLEPLGGGEIVGGLQQATAERKDLSVRARRVFDVQIEMNLLAFPCGHSGGVWSGAS